MVELTAREELVAALIFEKFGGRSMMIREEVFAHASGEPFRFYGVELPALARKIVQALDGAGAGA